MNETKLAKNISLYDLMIMSENLYQNPLLQISPATMPEWNAAWFIRKKTLCTLMSKGYRNYHFLHCVVKPQL